MATSPQTTRTTQPTAPAELGTRLDGADLGGIASTPEPGLADSLQRSSERAGADGSSLPPATPDTPPTAAPDDAKSAAGGAARPTAPDAPVPSPQHADAGSAREDPKDESTLESLGRAVSEIVTGADDDTGGDPATPRRPG